MSEVSNYDPGIYCFEDSHLQKPAESLKQESGTNEQDVVATGSSTLQPAAARLVSELQTKHPLQNTWDLWYYKNVSSVFEENLFNITSVDTVEDFWGFVFFVFCFNYCPF